MNNLIRCPACSHEFEPSSAMSASIRKELEADFALTKRTLESTLEQERRKAQDQVARVQEEAEFRIRFKKTPFARRP